MSDIIDRANDAADRFTRQALDACRVTASHRPSRTHCLACHEPIPEARRKAQPGCVRCAPCQAELEHLTHHWRL